jgi:hypothetical protein
MEKYGHLIGTTIVAFLVTAVLNFTTYRLSSDDGEISIGAPLQVHEQTYVPISVSNFGDRMLDGLEVQLPKSVRPETITTSMPLTFSTPSAVASAAAQQLVVVSAFPPHSETRLLVPTTASDAHLVRVPNAEAHHLGTRVGDGVRSPWWTAALTAVLSALVMTVAGMAVLALGLAGIRRSREEFDKHRKDLDRLHEELKTRMASTEAAFQKGQNEIRDLRVSTARLRLVLLQRVSDYRRELVFWRDTIRRLLSPGDGSVAPDTVFRRITEALKTYSTLGVDRHEMDSIAVLAALTSGRTPDLGAFEVVKPNTGTARPEQP